MPHSSHKNVDAPMDAWDRMRLGIALMEIRDALAGVAGDSAQLERVSKAVSDFVNENDPADLEG